MSFLAAIVPGWRGLVILQGLALGGTVIPIWAIARRHGNLDVRRALVIAAVVVANPLIWNVSLTGFHPEVVMLPVLCAGPPAGTPTLTPRSRWGRRSRRR